MPPLLSPTVSALIGVVAAVFAVASAVVGEKRRRRITGYYEETLRWERERAKLDLIGVSEHADRYAAQGVGQPGTQAVRTLYPGFDFTMGGKYEGRPLRNTDNVRYAPWTLEEVASLAEYQDSGTSQPYTCGLDVDHGNLVPDAEGWKCRVCPYTQRWAFRYVVDGSWRSDRDRLTGLFRIAEPTTPRRNGWATFTRRRLGLFRRTTSDPERTVGDL